MSLQVWLPLNGDLKNYGCTNLKFSTTTSNTTLATGGKIGQCYNNNSNTLGGLISDTKIDLTQTQSMFCWFKFTTLISSSNLGCGLVTQHRYRNCTGMGITIKYASSTTGYLSVNTGNGNGTRTYNTYCGTTLLQANTWYHGGYTYDGNALKIYVNGICENTQSITGMAVPSDGLIIFGWSWETADGAITSGSVHNNYKLNGYLNDVRIYDECLSPKQVKEISKALIVHYPLNDQYNSSVLNKYSGSYAEGNATTVEATLTKTKLAEERGYNFKGTYTGVSGTNHYARLQWPTYLFTAGKVYFYSVKIRCHKWSSGSFMLRAARSSNDYGTGMTYVTVCQPAYADDQWHEYYVSQTINETYERGGSTVTCNPLFEFYTSNQNGNGTVYEMDFDLKDVQVVESDTYIPFIKNEFANATVFDTSGFMNNGTATGLTCTSDSPRYSSSSLFGSNRGIFCDKTMVPRVDGEPLTVSCWFKQLGRSGYQDIVSNRASSSFNWLLYTHSTDGSIQFHGANQNKSTVIPSLNAWHHIVAVVYTNSTYSLFLDGSKVVNAASYTYRVATSVGICIGKYGNLTTFTEPFDGYISDVRIYATALSDDDIKELYQTSASFDNLGNIHAYEISENL